MRLVLLASTSALLVAVATFACSSAEPSGEPEEESELPDDEDNTGENTPPTDNPTPDATTPADDAGVPETSTPFDANFDAGTLCQPTDTKETEANDTEGTADPLSGIPSVYCGRLAAGETDFATFTLNTASFTTAFDWSQVKPSMTATVEGQTFNLDSQSYVYMPGKTYIVKITANGGPTDYRIQLLP
jgi:hypothetical protein